MHRLDKATGYREPETGAGADMVALLRAIEFVKYALQLRRWNAVAFVDDLQGDPIPVPQPPDRYRGAGGSVFFHGRFQSQNHLLVEILVDAHAQDVDRERKLGLAGDQDLDGAPQ